MKALSRLEFDSLLDVGGAEGYTAYIVKRLFNAKVRNSDLSEEACKRAGEIFDIESITADIHDLPFKNNEFDVVLCSETLEHVADLDRAIGELLKVASKAVVITVPYEPREVVDKNVEEQIPHGHLHHFDLKSFNFLQSYGHHILSRKMVSPLLMIHAVLMEAEPIPEEYCEKMRLPEIFTDIYNASMPILRKLFGKKTAAFLIALDDFVCKFTPFHNTILFVVLKDNRCYRREEIPKISAYQIINLGVPYHYVEKSVD